MRRETAKDCVETKQTAESSTVITRSNLIFDIVPGVNFFCITKACEGRNRQQSRNEAWKKMGGEPVNFLYSVMGRFSMQ
jgi:hypothetical protein